jgi:hypothetical protein
MHKGVICLTQAADKDEAISNVESFLEQDTFVSTFNHG